MNEWMQDKAVREGSEGSLVDVMILEQLAGQHRWRGEWVLLGFVSWRHLLLVQPECQTEGILRTELWEACSQRDVCRAHQPRGRLNCWNRY